MSKPEKEKRAKNPNPRDYRNTSNRENTIRNTNEVEISKRICSGCANTFTPTYDSENTCFECQEEGIY